MNYNLVTKWGGYSLASSRKGGWREGKLTPSRLSDAEGVTL